ncbi:MAG: folate-binding protein YgfZ, partial [Chitinophagales bacterium]|nr:folate-binding protein YgfZ [Hyphomicrobiales bacterium]
MQNQHSTALLNRGVLRVSGPDAGAFLQGLITNDLDKTVDGRAIYTALLSPQGKILFSFFIVRREDAFWIDYPSELAAALAKRLALYKLRSAVAIEDVSEAYCVTATWGEGGIAGEESFADPRLPPLGYRRISPRTELVDSAGYDAHRIALAVPEGGRDYVYGDAFPHDVCMDLLNGVDFKKGCYVGQEIVSRMQHRGTARRRVVAVVAETPLTEGVDIIAGG